MKSEKSGTETRNEIGMIDTMISVAPMRGGVSTVRGVEES
jgi:hypothetical protein